MRIEEKRKREKRKRVVSLSVTSRVQELRMVMRLAPALYP